MTTLIIAHSGCEGAGRDSLLSIDRAAAAGADAIEIDIRLSPEGELRVSHDALSAEACAEKPLAREALARGGVADNGFF